jgi:hypothetical protein
MQISFIYFSVNAGDMGIAEWVSLWDKNELVSLYSAANIPQSRFSHMEKANFGIVYPNMRSFYPH